MKEITYFFGFTGGGAMAGGRGTPFADLPPGSIHIATAGNGRGFPGLFQVRRIFFDSFWDFIFHFLYKKTNCNAPLPAFCTVDFVK